MNAAITLSQVSFGYRRRKPVLENVSLELQKGHIYGLLGENGAGKSTFLKLLAGLVFPKSGDIDTFGHQPRHRQASFLSNLFFIPEDFYLPPVRIAEYVGLYAPFYEKFGATYFFYLLDEFRIDRGSRIEDLSYGQRKKLLIAFGLASRTPLLLMDEPTNGLDIPSKSILRRVLSSALTKERLFLISTHQVRDLDNLIDEVIVLRDTRVALAASMDEIATRLYFGSSDEVPKGAIYYEESLSGYHTVNRNPSVQYSKVNLELLFKAIVREGQAVATQFTTQKMLSDEQQD
ncbi:ABC transporter ATP-binding protein [Parapedobacter sp. DT-150]|uniref:ABC transporter ATP-binding protein n=1 Tax=Parapedobacter sp. DT-150 TaxID=3396162 RepID=UPI003F1A73F9